MSTRPRDICTAAFYDDLERVRQLVVAAGVYTGRWQPPCHINTSPAVREGIDADLMADGAAVSDDGPSSRRANVSSHEADTILSEEEAEELTELISEEEMTALMAHPELQRVTQAYALEPADDENNDSELLDEEEEEAAEADRQAQQHDLLIYRCMLAEQRHRESVAQRLQQHGFVQVSTTPPVDLTPYGILFSCREKAVPSSSAWAPGEEVESSATATPLQVRWQPSKRSRYAGTPLHWAVLGRAHAMVKFLVEHGADELAGLIFVDSTTTRSTPAKGEHAASDSMKDTTAMRVLAQLTPGSMAEANESYATLHVLDAALAARAANQADREAFYVALEQRMQRRQQRYVRRRQIAVARRALQANAQREAEEWEKDEEEGRATNEGDDDGDGEKQQGEGEDAASDGN